MEDRALTDVELAALTALAHQEAIAMEGANALREIQGYSPAYGDGAMLEAAARIEKELRRRGVL